MAFVTGMMILDAPASALNNSGLDKSASTANRVLVKKIRTADGWYPYVSAQAFRYWLRSAVAESALGFEMSPVHLGEDIAFSDSNPIVYWDDDLFGYMRAPKSSDKTGIEFGTGLEKKAGKSKKNEYVSITRTSPFRVSTFVSIAPVAITDDFGTMARQDGHPVIHQHEFYSAHLRGLVSLDLTSCGTFYDAERVGYKNLDSYRRDKAAEANCESVTVRKQKAFRLPLAKRLERVSALVKGLAGLNGGAKQTLHYTDLMPAVVVMAITKGGNHPFYRMFNGTGSGRTVLHEGAVREIFESFSSDLLSPVYIGWAQGFLDEERAKFDALKTSLNAPHGIEEIAHPRTVLLKLSEELAKHEHADWYA